MPQIKDICIMQCNYQCACGVITSIKKFCRLTLILLKVHMFNLSKKSRFQYLRFKMAFCVTIT